jgi:catechol 2,3-dioxygenase-like lactoylglutathione lyase family enzyme
MTASHTNLPLATVHGLFHIAIKTDDLAATRKFWTEIIGLRDFDRPDFGYPGAWLGCTQPGGIAIIHVYAGGPALGPTGKAEAGTYIDRFRANGLDWREFIVPGTSLWQLFVYDPSGVQLELTFEAGVEGEEKPDMLPRRKYVAGATFFDKATYPKLV